jgi:hypothetical protein
MRSDEDVECSESSSARKMDENVYLFQECILENTICENAKKLEKCAAIPL